MRALYAPGPVEQEGASFEPLASPPIVGAFVAALPPNSLAHP
jgi:hypothetical protein